MHRGHGFPWTSPLLRPRVCRFHMTSPVATEVLKASAYCLHLAQVKKGSQERVILQVSVWEGKGGVARKSHFHQPPHDHQVPQGGSLSPSLLLHSPWFPTAPFWAEDRLQDLSLLYPQLGQRLGRWDQVKVLEPDSLIFTKPSDFC